MKKFLSFILTLCACFAIGGLIQSNVVNAEGTTVSGYKAATSADDIANGKKFIIVSKAKGYVAGVWDKKQYKSENITITESIIPTETTTIFTAEVISGNTFKIKDTKTNKYLENPTGSNNKATTDLKQVSTATDFYWTITINNQDTDSIVPSTASNRKLFFGSRSPYNLKSYAEDVSNIDIYVESGAVATNEVKFYDDDKLTVFETKSVAVGGSIDLDKIIPTKEGYTFVGWENANKEPQAGSIVVNSNLDLYAKWKVDLNVHVTIDENTFTSLTEKNSAYADFDGSHIINGLKITTKDVMSKSNKIQMRKSSGLFYFETPTLGLLKKVVFNDLEGSVRLFSSNERITALPSNGYTELTKDNNSYTVKAEARYLVVRATSEKTVYASSIDIIHDGSETISPLLNLETKSSLKIKYDANTKIANDVDMRFGGIIPADKFIEGFEYGVVAIGADSTDDVLNRIMEGSLTREDIDALKLSGNAYAINPVRVNSNGVADPLGDSYQFAWVIDNLEGHYDFEFAAILYATDGTNYYCAEFTSYSVISLATYYFDNSTELGLSKVELEVLTNLAS